MASKVLVYLRKLFCGEGITPLPKTLMVTIYSLSILNAMTITMVFSYLPKFVQHLGASELETGMYTGIIASSLYLGRIFSSILWGYLADVKGKKLSLIASCSCVVFTAMAFGFSLNIYWALVTRFLQGFSMGLIIICKAMLAEACDDTNMAFGMSILISSNGLGQVFGSSIGGFLAFPVEQYPAVFSKDGFLEKYVVFLPTVVIALGFVINIILAGIYLPRNYRNRIDEETALLSNKESSSKCSVALFKKPESKIARRVLTIEKFKESRLFRILQLKHCVACCFIYLLISFLLLGQLELLPLFAATSTNYYGLEFNTSEIGTVLLVVSFLLVVLQLTIVPKITNYLGAKKMIIVCSLGQSFLYPLVPVVSAFKNSIILWVVLIINVSITRGLMVATYTAVNILINNSVPIDQTGVANGFAMMISSFGRMLAPAVFGFIYSWSLTNVKDLDSTNANPMGFPFNQFFGYHLCALFAILIAFFTSMLPNSLNYREDPEGNGTVRT